MTQDIASNRILGAIALVLCAAVIFWRRRVSITTHTQPPFKGMAS